MGYHILIADDEQEIVDFLRLYLEKDGYEVFAAYDGREAVRVLGHEQIDLVLVDIMMPHMNGYELTRHIRETKNIPIIMLSAKGETADKVLGLGLGADDYVTKPFEPLEVAARVEANIRRFYQLSGQNRGNRYLIVRDLKLDTCSCILYKAEVPTELTSIEFKILRLFMGAPGRVFTKKQIYESAWEEEYLADDSNIMVYISKIREKLGERDGTSYIKTIRGLGYKMLSE